MLPLVHRGHGRRNPMVPSQGSLVREVAWTAGKQRVFGVQHDPSRSR